MRATELAILYLIIGCGSAIALMVMDRRSRRILDAVLLLPFWPLYGPFLLISRPEAGDPKLARLQQCLAKAGSRIAEIDRLLARPELDARSAAARLVQLRERGDERAAASVQARLTSIERLERLRERFEREVTEIEELLAQLRVQSEVFRLAGGADTGTRELLDDIICRVDGLEAILAIELV